MRSICLTFILLSVTVAVKANEKIYNRLNKIYLSNPELCLEKAKKYMDKKPNEAASYYFASTIYSDKMEQSQTLRGKYLHLRRAINHARKFDKIGQSELKQKVLWSEKLEALQAKTTQLIKALDKNHQEDLSQELIENINQLESIAELEKPIKFDEIVIEFTPTIKKESEFVKIETHFYGIPTGNEYVTSASYESEKQLLELINKARIGKNIPPLTWNEDLAKASRYHAYDLGTQAYFDHKSCDRINGELVEVSSTFERINKFYNATHVNAENIAAGNSLPNTTYLQWFNSKGHNDNMFNPDSRFIGIGVCYVPNSPHGYYWVMSTAE